MILKNYNDFSTDCQGEEKDEFGMLSSKKREATTNRDLLLGIVCTRLIRESMKIIRYVRRGVVTNSQLVTNTKWSSFLMH